MGTEEALLIYVLGAVIGLAVTYAVIRFAVVHALRSHALWVAQGGVEREVQRLTERHAQDDDDHPLYTKSTGQ